MCNLSELVKEGAVKQERIAAVQRMLKADAAKEQIISFGYTEEEIEKAESVLYENVQCFLITKNDRVFHKIRLCGMPLFLCKKERRPAIYEKRKRRVVEKILRILGIQKEGKRIIKPNG